MTKKSYQTPVEMGTGNKHEVDYEWIPREVLNHASKFLQETEEQEITILCMTIVMIRYPLVRGDLSKTFVAPRISCIGMEYCAIESKFLWEIITVFF